MRDRPSFENPFDVARPRHVPTALLLLDNVEERGSGCPNDPDAQIIHLAIDVQVAAGDHCHLVANAGCEQPGARRMWDGGGCEPVVLGILLERRQMLEQHRWSAVAVTERSLQKLILCPFLRMPTAEECRINADQAPRAH